MLLTSECSASPLFYYYTFHYSNSFSHSDKNLCLLVVEWYCSSQVFNLLDNSYFLVKLWKTRGSPLFFSFFFLLENTYSTRIVWKKKQTWQATVNELRPLYRLWLCRWGIHDSADLRSRHQHQAHASSDIGETGQRTTGWGDLPRVPYALCPSPDSNQQAYAYESKLRTMRPPRAPKALPYSHITCRDAHTHIRIFMKLVRVVALPSDRAAVWRCPDNRCGRSVWKLPPYHVRGTLYPCPMRTTTECTVYVEHVMWSCAPWGVGPGFKFVRICAARLLEGQKYGKLYFVLHCVRTRARARTGPTTTHHQLTSGSATPPCHVFKERIRVRVR